MRQLRLRVSVRLQKKVGEAHEAWPPRLQVFVGLAAYIANRAGLEPLVSAILQISPCTGQRRIEGNLLLGLSRDKFT